MVLTATPTMLFPLGQRGIIRYISPSVAKLLGAQAELLLNRKLTDKDLPSGMLSIVNFAEPILKTSWLNVISSAPVGI